jgi:hypothetical protein
LDWLHHERIPYLGEIQVASHGTSNAIALGTAERSSPMLLEANGPKHSTKSLRLLRSIGEGSLVLWLGLFFARLLFDPLWRELVSVAPLAAISRMISGIQ